MFSKDLMNAVPESKKYIALNVIFQWLMLILNVGFMSVLALFLTRIYTGEVSTKGLWVTIIFFAFAILGRFFLIQKASQMSYMAAKSVKPVLRTRIYKKLIRLGSSYTSKITTSEVVQLTTEGIDQLEIYFGGYMPQLFYSVIAPVTLFIVISTINLPTALILLIATPLIPISIVAVQKVAKKLFSKYWGEYVTLGDSFLENLQGLTTLKIYQADEHKNEEMNEKAEVFRKITMRVLVMQLNSVTVMDLIAFGGAAIGIIMAITQFSKGNIDLTGCLLILFLSADFFIPMRQLGSYFHIAMNGIGASEKIFYFLGLQEPKCGNEELMAGDHGVQIQHLHFSYEKDKEILHDVSMHIPSGGLTALVGESGSGKSTIASILAGRQRDYSGDIVIGHQKHAALSAQTIMNNITYIGTNCYIFKGTVRDNLLMALPEASDDRLWQALRKCRLDTFLMENQGLETVIHEKGSNLSGGQRQRIAIAQGLLRNSAIYIFDESTSNIDVESENLIIELIYELAKTKTVLFITHRLLNVVNAEKIYMVEAGRIIEEGSHSDLLIKSKAYAQQWLTQNQLEGYRKGRVESV
ncbi:ABC transporter ATP-binding protein/permease [Fusibacter bizertensis]